MQAGSPRGGISARAVEWAKSGQAPGAVLAFKKEPCVVGQMDGRVVLITGAARGQGRAHGIRFAEEGADIIALDICEQIPLVAYPLGTAEELQETVRYVEKLGRRCLSFQADARNSARLRDVVAQGVAELGRLDTVIINH